MDYKLSKIYSFTSICTLYIHLKILVCHILPILTLLRLNRSYDISHFKIWVSGFLISLSIIPVMTLLIIKDRPQYRYHLFSVWRRPDDISFLKLYLKIDKFLKSCKKKCLLLYTSVRTFIVVDPDQVNICTTIVDSIT